MRSNQTEPVQVYRRSWCEDSDSAVAYFKDKDIAFEEIDIEKATEAGEGVKFITGGHHITPTLLYRMQAVVFDPWDPGRFEEWWRFANRDSEHH